MFTIPLSERRLACTPWSGPTAEELLSAAEEGEGDTVADGGVLLPAVAPARLAAALARLPAVEADIIELMGRGVRQRVIGELLSLTQPGVSYRALKAQERLRWLLLEEGGLFTAEELEEALVTHGTTFSPRERLLLVALWRTTSQSEACRAAEFHQPYGCGLLQPWVRTSARSTTDLFRDRPPSNKTRPGLITLLSRIPELALFARGFRALAGYDGRPKRWNILNFYTTGGGQANHARRLARRLARAGA